MVGKRVNVSKPNQRVFNKYFIILVIGFIGWIAETAYFGFNKTPESGAEGFLDVVFTVMMIYGLIGDLSRNVRITKHYHNISTTRINTKRVSVEGDNQKVIYNSTFKVTPEVMDRLKGAKSA